MTASAQGFKPSRYTQSPDNIENYHVLKIEISLPHLDAYGVIFLVM